MNSPVSLNYVPCPTCSGTGFITNENGSLQCPNCTGTCGWLETSSGQQLVYPFQLFLTGKKKGKSVLYFWYVLAVISCVITTISFASLLISAFPNLLYTFWQGGKWAQVGFGFGGLVSMLAVTNAEKLQTSIKSVDDLSATLKVMKAGEKLSLEPYLNDRIIDLLELAALQAIGRGSAQIEESDCVAALFDHPRIQMMIARLEISPESIHSALAPYQQPSGKKLGKTQVSPALYRRLYQACQEAISNQFPYIDLEDIVLAYLPMQKDDQDGLTSILKEVGITRQNFLTVSKWYAEEQEQRRNWEFWIERGRSRPKSYMNRGWTALPTPFLDQYSTDLTLTASMGSVSAATVRKAELDQALATLSGTTVRNVLFVGDPGTGTEVLLTAVATRMLGDNVPESLVDKRLVSLDVSRLLTAGKDGSTAMQQALDDVQNAGNVILAIPEIEALSNTNQGQLDGSSVLANALKQGSVQVVSTASFADYHRYVEQNALLKSLLQVIELHQLTVEETITLLEEEAGTLESTYTVRLSYPALENAAKLGEQYLSEDAPPAGARKLLEKAAQLAQQGGKIWVNQEGVKKAVETLTHVPVTMANGDEAEKLLNLESLLHARVVGQVNAVHAVSEALRRARTGLSNSNRPLGSFMFVGPTGVGKTELAKALCEVYFNPDHNMVRFDMSEYQEPRSIYRLIGAPAEGNQSVEGGELTQAVREHPFTLLLFDEIEKAHPDVLNLFLQMLDDGRITENTGRTVHLNTCIIIATSNAGSQLISQLLKDQIPADQLTPQILTILEKNFRPEFLNRFDGIIPFQPLNMDDLDQIASLIIKSVSEKAAAQDITLEITPEAKQKLVEQGYNPAYGARPLRRTIEQKIEGIMANALLRKEIQPGDTLRITPEMLD